MKKFNAIVLGMIFSFSLYAQRESEYFYYHKGEKIYLEIDLSRILVISEGTISESNIRNKIVKYSFDVVHSKKSITKQNVIAINNIQQPIDNNESFTEIFFPKNDIAQSEYFEIIRQFQEEPNIIKVSPSFLINGKKLDLSNNFYVKLRTIDDIEKLSKMANEYFIQILGSNKYMPLWVTLSCTRQTPMNIIEVAKLFHESLLFEYVEPEFLYHDLLTTNDTYYNDQWGLKNTGQHGGTPNTDIHAESAWTVSTGSPNIRVAVFDQGIKMDHPDLINNIYGTGYDAETGTIPSQLRNSHGTPCAGIIGASQNNSIGGSGVAPNSKLMSISIDLDWGNTPQQLANGFNWAWQNGADIISNSWGGYSPSSIIDDAITSTMVQGRNGKGTIVIFASGNENNTNIRYPGKSNPDILVVGAISPCGERKSYTSCDGEGWGSCYGTQLDVVAPGVFIPTTTYTGGYTLTFNGTSAACPHVAGLAALILSVNPTLTNQQVRNIIESTAQKVGGYSYQTTSGRSNGTWNNEMGYGLIDAYSSVSSACSTTYNFTDQTVTANTAIEYCGKINVQNVTVTNNAKLTLDGIETTINGPFEMQSGAGLEIN
ncbi:MAG: S8 family serine peptidase [Bacteroidales bacterium]|jgi:subtilisin family serine protease|nr:S8 family serine peptidase [Bacteroidales bacterium]